jgi:very-short-patch-repair endonuclease
MSPEKLIYSYNTLVARRLRKEQTKAEKLLWERLRNRRFKGEKFKRQQGIGSYITDFYCYAHRLVGEVDGSIHNDLDQSNYDIRREAILNDSGFNVIRFTNIEVFTDIDKVLEEIGKDLA